MLEIKDYTSIFTRHHSIFEGYFEIGAAKLDRKGRYQEKLSSTRKMMKNSAINRIIFSNPLAKSAIPINH